MSTDFVTSRKIRSSDLFDGRLEKFGVREHVSERTKPGFLQILTDGNNYLDVGIDDNGFVGLFVRWSLNAPGRILDAIAEAFETEIFSEYEPQFWGFDTDEEWEQAMKKDYEEYEAIFYEDVMKYVQGGKHEIRAGTVGETKAKIAKKLVADKPELILPENKRELLDAIDLIYERDHTIRIELDEADIAFARMQATHEDDLPQA